MKNLKSNKGITLLDITIYMIAILITIGIMTMIKTYFFNNINIVKETARYAAEFDNFNTFFVSDVKEYTDIEIDDINKTYTFKNSSKGNRDMVYYYKIKSVQKQTGIRSTASNTLNSSLA